MTEPIVAYKGFNADWTCRGFQYELGKTYAEDAAVLCKRGFHACENPLDIFAYYDPTGQMATVELRDVAAATDDDSKRVGKIITIKAALTIPMLVTAAIEFIVKQCDPAKAAHATGYRSASSATGDHSASSATGYHSASSATGYQSASSATGYHSASSATGYQSASSATGDQSASSATGDQSASSATGYHSASSATGYQSASSATGYQSASSATGYNAVAAAFCIDSKAMAGETGIVIVAWWDGARKRLTTGYVGEDGIQADTWYRTDKSGRLEEVK